MREFLCVGESGGGDKKVSFTEVFLVGFLSLSNAWLIKSLSGRLLEGVLKKWRVSWLRGILASLYVNETWRKQK